MIVAAIASVSGEISFVTYSITSHKGFLLGRLPLPSSVLYVMNMEYEQDVAIVLDFYNIYIISIDNFGSSYIVDYINEV